LEEGGSSVDSFDDGSKSGPIDRRAVLKTGLGWGVGLSLAPKLGFGQEDPAASRPQEGDLLVRAGDTTLNPLTPEDVPLAAAPTPAWPMDQNGKTVRSGLRLNSLLLMRLDSATLSPDTRAMSAGGVVAYSALCSHTGCDVTDFIVERGVLSCDCHGATFDPKDRGKVVDGPATRALPALPLKLVDGKLVVAKGFTAPIRFEMD
jgi:Rieske Fe-S protein